MPFSLDLVPTPQKKRASEEAATGESTPTQPEKRARASEIVIEQGPRPQKPASRRPETAPWHICIYKVSDCAGDLWSNFESAEDAALYACLMEHEARQSALLYLRDAFNAYLASARVENPAIPQDLPSLQEKCGIRLVVADAEDPLGVGVKQWMTCFYVAGALESLHNFLVLLDGFIAYKAKASAKQFDGRNKSLASWLLSK